MTLRKSLLAACLMLASTAQAGGFVGFSAGVAQSKDVVSENELRTEGFDEAAVDDSATAFKAYIGTELNDVFALRVGYANLGEVATIEASSADTRIDNAIEVSAVFVDALLQAKLDGGLRLFAKLGAAYTMTEVDYREVFDDGVISFNTSGTDKASEVEFVPGVGIAFQPSDTFGITLEAERYLDVGDADETGESDIDVISLGAYFTF